MLCEEEQNCFHFFTINLMSAHSRLGEPKRLDKTRGDQSHHCEGGRKEKESLINGH